MEKSNSLRKRILAALLSGLMTASCFVTGTAFTDTKVYAEEISTATTHAASTDDEEIPFSWDNATVYFTLIDRFVNGDPSNDHSYGRGLQADESTPQVGLEGSKNTSNPGTFHGGDLKGLTQKVNEGYFNDLGVNAIWISSPLEQIHGFTSGHVKGDSGQAGEGGGFPYYSYHGYWALDYSNIDANMGSEQDFADFVDAAHRQGIRVVMDVVLNHVGYVTMKDADTYGFGSLKSGWQDYYYGDVDKLSGGKPESQTWYDFNSSNWSKWWGAGFVRVSSPYSGYTQVSDGDGYTPTLSGLPDIKTESTTVESVPELMKTKWTQEGRYAQETNELNSFFSSTGLSATPRNYFIKWLTDWVREYGVDGFRCDTAKHVEPEAWKSLKEQSSAALAEWRANNPTKAGADWDEDFWMTGEHWGHGVGKDHYFSNGFDSIINFTFPRDGATGASLETTYSSYAKSINSDPSFNVLSYVSSHDDGLGNRNNLIGCGTALLLAPGGVQIFYGDETGRPLQWDDFFTGGDYKDQRYRSDMNWSSIDTNVQKHWQIVGQFRNKHLAVGAGQHQQISTSPYTFSRIYSGNGTADRVVVSMPGKSGSVTVDCGGTFSAGAKVRDFYTDTLYTVGSDGTVTVNAGANGLVLLEKGDKSPDIGVFPNSKTYYTDTLELTLSVTNNANATYSLNGGSKKSYTNGTKLTIGAGLKYGDVTTITLEASNEDGTAGPATYTYVKGDPADKVITIRAKKDGWTTAPYIYVYSEEVSPTAELTGAWPGTQMTSEGDGWYSITCEATDAMEGPTAKFILNGGSGSWQDPAQDQPGYDVTSGAQYENGVVTPLANCKVTVKHVDENGKEIASQETLTGQKGAAYTTKPAAVVGYKVKTVPSNATGVFTEQPITVTYTYVACETGTVNVVYEDTDGNVLDTETLVGEVGTAYTTEAKEIKGYTLSKTPSNATGKYTKADITVTYVYEKDPTPQGTKIYFEKPSNWGSNINAYIYDESVSPTKKIAAWPGVAMTNEGNGVYSYFMTEEYAKPQVIFNDGSNQVPGAQQPGFEMKNNGYYDSTGFVKYMDVEVTKVTLSPSSLNLTVGNSGKLAATVTPSDATDKTLTWTSSNTSVATVSDGTVTAKAAGTATITATSVNGKSGTATVTVTKPSDDLKVTSFTTDKGTSAVSGTQVTLTATGTGGTGGYQYAFSVCNSEGKWYKIQAASAKNTAVWNASPAGQKTLYAYVKDSSGKVEQKTINFTVTDSKPLTVSSFTTNKGTSATKGTKVTLTATASGGTGSYQYAFSVCNSEGKWYKIQAASAKNTAVWDATPAGQKTLYAYVKDASGKVEQKTINFTVTDSESLTVSSFTTDKGTSAASGTQVTLTATGAGGTGGYQYAFSVCNSEGKWYKIQAASAKNTAIWNASPAGQKTLYAYVKDSSGKVEQKTINFTVTDVAETGLAVSSFTTDKGTSAAAGTSVTLTATATGGSGFYQYAFSVCNSEGKWYKIQEASAKRTAVWKATPAGTKTLYAYVKDSNGKVAQKTLNFTVK